MKISTLNSIPTVKRYEHLNNKSKNAITSGSEQKQNKNLLDYPQNYRPSFGLLADVVVFATVFCTLDLLRQRSELKAQSEKLLKINNKETNENSPRNKEIKKISQKYHIPVSQAKKYYDGFLKVAAIEPKGDGNEIGLNSVRGYGVEKCKLAVDFITPIIAKNGKMFIKTENVPNGLLMYGPPGSGKTYMAEKTCEHLAHFGVRVVNVELSPNDHKKNAEIITNAFENGKERFKQIGKYTVINFTQDIDNIFMKRSISTKNLPEIIAFMKCSNNCAAEGVSWIGTANEPKQLDKVVLKVCRTDIKMPVGEMENFAVEDMINYSLIKYGQKTSAENFDFSKVVNEMKEKEYVFTPSELDRIVKFAVNHKMHPDMPLTEDMLISEMNDYNENEFPTLTPEEIQRFKENQKYVEGYIV